MENDSKTSSAVWVALGHVLTIFLGALVSRLVATIPWFGKMKRKEKEPS